MFDKVIGFHFDPKDRIVGGALAPGPIVNSFDGHVWIRQVVVHPNQHIGWQHDLVAVCGAVIAHPDRFNMGFKIPQPKSVDEVTCDVCKFNVTQEGAKV